MDVFYLASCIYLSGSTCPTVHECGMMSRVVFGILKVLLDGISKGLSGEPRPSCCCLFPGSSCSRLAALHRWR